MRLNWKLKIEMKSPKTSGKIGKVLLDMKLKSHKWARKLFHVSQKPLNRSLVSSALEISKSIEKHDFLILLKSAGFRYPDHEHVYWRIGKNLSVNELEFFRHCHEYLSVYSLHAG